MGKGKIGNSERKQQKPLDINFTLGSMIEGTAARRTVLLAVGTGPRGRSEQIQKKEGSKQMEKAKVYFTKALTPEAVIKLYDVLGAGCPARWR